MKNTFFFAALLLVDLFACCHSHPQNPLPGIEDAKFIEDCVTAHNKFRSKVTPSASNMYRMSWDAALAKTAKAWAKKCIFKHNIYLEMPGKVHPTFTPVGENIWTGTATAFSVDAALSDWFNEVSSYDFNTHSCSDMCGHYTQVVWAETYKVGCAVHFCNKIENLPGFFKVAHFICNYGPAGNYPRKPYKAGQPCLRCSNETCIDKLCENTERQKLINYANWYPDWDKQPPPPRPHPPRPTHPFCDQYCLTVSILRPLFLVLSVCAAFLVEQRFLHVFFYE